MTTRFTWAGCGAAIAVSAAVAFASGCGGNTGTPAAEQTPAPAAQTQPQAPPAAQTAPASQAAPAPAAEAAATAAAPTAPAASAFVQDHESGVEVTLVEAKRTGGDSVTVKWRYRNTAGTDVKIAKGGTSWLDAYQLTADAFLIDPVNKKKYLVITDAEKYPLASKHGDWQGVTLTPGQTLSSWAKFPAPPSDVDKVSITIAGVPPFEDVPVIK